MIYTQSTHLISTTTPNDYTVLRLMQSSVFRSRDEFSRHNDAIISNTGHSCIRSLLNETNELSPEREKMTVTNGENIRRATRDLEKPQEELQD